YPTHCAGRCLGGRGRGRCNRFSSDDAARPHRQNPSHRSIELSLCSGPVLGSALAFAMLLYIKLMKVKKGVAKLSCGSLKFALLWLVLLSLTACVGLPVHGSVVGQTIE